MDEKQKMQEILNHSLSGLKEDPFLAQRVIAKAKGEPEMKKKLTSSIVLIVILLLALIGSACAVFSSQVADFFRQYWGRDLGDWIEEGGIARIGESAAVGDVVFTLDEVVYRDRGIYGVGTARAADPRDVLVPMDLADDWRYWSQRDEGQALIRKAEASGGRLLQIDCAPVGFSVDGGATVNSGDVGLYNVRNEDGTITFSFETGGYALEDGTSYRMTLDLSVSGLSPDGEWKEGSRQSRSWTLSFEPAAAAEQPDTAVNAEDIQRSGYEIVIPAVYDETHTLPVRRAVETDFTGLTDPEWFNRTGIQEKKSGSGFVNYTFNDHAVLNVSRELVWYAEYTDELFDYNQIARELDDPDLEPMMLPKQALSFGICDIASNIYYQIGDFTADISLERTELTSITLAEAEAKAEELFDRFHLSGYELAWALDMDVERIRTLGRQYNEFWFEGGGFTNSPRQDFDMATAEDEGYYLYYTPMGVKEISDTRHEITLFITHRGITFASIRSNYTMQDPVEIPEKLIAPQQAVDRLYEEIARSGNGGKVVRVRRVALTYVAIRAEDKQDWMVFFPVWQVLYTDEAGEAQGYSCWAEFNAVSGTLINASFR